MSRSRINKYNKCISIYKRRTYGVPPMHKYRYYHAKSLERRMPKPIGKVFYFDVLDIDKQIHSNISTDFNQWLFIL